MISDIDGQIQQSESNYFDTNLHVLMSLTITI